MSSSSLKNLWFFFRILAGCCKQNKKKFSDTFQDSISNKSETKLVTSIKGTMPKINYNLQSSLAIHVICNF